MAIRAVTPEWGHAVCLAALALCASGCSSAPKGSPASSTSKAPSPSCGSEDCNWPPPGGDWMGSAGNASVARIMPKFGPTVTATVPPPPISGGTLLVTHDGKFAVAADPDRDAVYVVSLTAKALTFTISLKTGDEPGRLAEDGAGRVHVALRGGGALVTIDPLHGSILTRRTVCPAPRGVAFDSSADSVWVACATGELVELPSAGGAATHSFVLDRDLRDVIVEPAGLTVTTFRAAQVLRVSRAGSVLKHDTFPSTLSNFAPHVAWRAVPAPAGALVATHQAESTVSVSTMTANSDGWAAGTSPPPVLSVLTVLGPDGTPAVNEWIPAVLPVDVALSPDNRSAAVVVSGEAFMPQPNTVMILALPSVGADAGSPDAGSPDASSTFVQADAAATPASAFSASGEPIAVAFVGPGQLLVQSREPANLDFADLSNLGAITTVALSKTSRDDSGHDVFHSQSGGMVACASCHPEGGDDGHVWILDSRTRRTPSLRGTIVGTAPYHWPGDEADLPTLINDVYTGRMAGATLTDPQRNALVAWVQSIPAPPMPSWVDPAASARGKVIFERSDTACTTCHSGPKLTNNATLDVGTGSPFQVPPLVGVGWRAPLLHDGCAATLAERLGGCATPRHGSTSSLSSQEISDLVAYLESL